MVEFYHTSGIVKLCYFLAAFELVLRFNRRLRCFYMRGTDCLVKGEATTKLRLKLLLHFPNLCKSFVLHDSISLCFCNCALLFLIGSCGILRYIVFGFFLLCFGLSSSLGLGLVWEFGFRPQHVQEAEDKAE